MTKNSVENKTSNMEINQVADLHIEEDAVTVKTFTNVRYGGYIFTLNQTEYTVWRSLSRNFSDKFEVYDKKIYILIENHERLFHSFRFEKFEKIKTFDELEEENVSLKEKVNELNKEVTSLKEKFNEIEEAVDVMKKKTKDLEEKMEERVDDKYMWRIHNIGKSNIIERFGNIFYQNGDECNVIYEFKNFHDFENLKQIVTLIHSSEIKIGKFMIKFTSGDGPPYVITDILNSFNQEECIHIEELYVGNFTYTRNLKTITGWLVSNLHKKIDLDVTLDSEFYLNFQNIKKIYIGWNISVPDNLQASDGRCTETRYKIRDGCDPYRFLSRNDVKFHVYPEPFI